MYSLKLDENNRILSVSYANFTSLTGHVVDYIPEGNIYEYKYIDGEFIHDPISIEEVVEQPSRIDIIEAQVVYTAMMNGTLLDSMSTLL